MRHQVRPLHYHLGFCVNYRHPVPWRGTPGVDSVGHVPFPLDPLDLLDLLDRREFLEIREGMSQPRGCREQDVDGLVNLALRATMQLIGPERSFKY